MHPCSQLTSSGDCGLHYFLRVDFCSCCNPPGVASVAGVMFMANDASVCRLQDSLSSHWSASVSSVSAVVFPLVKFKNGNNVPVQKYAAVWQEVIGPSGAVQTVSSKRRRPLFLIFWSERRCADGFRRSAVGHYF